MFRLLRIVVAIFAIGFAGAYFLGDSLRLSSGPELLTFEEFKARRPAVSQLDENFALLHDSAPRPAEDPRLAYDRYLAQWGQGDGTVLQAQPSAVHRLTDAFRRPWRRIYQRAAALLPDRSRAERRGLRAPAPATNHAPVKGIVVTLIALGAALMSTGTLNTWLKNASRV